MLGKLIWGPQRAWHIPPEVWDPGELCLCSACPACWPVHKAKIWGGDQKHHENLLQPVYVLNAGLIPGIQSTDSQHSWE